MRAKWYVLRTLPFNVLEALLSFILPLSSRYPFMKRFPKVSVNVADQARPFGRRFQEIILIEYLIPEATAEEPVHRYGARNR
jgi:hypothetical protein